MNRGAGVWIAAGIVVGAVIFSGAMLLGVRVALVPSPTEAALQQRLIRLLDRMEKDLAERTDSCRDASESALRSDLQTVRSQIELYKVQHLEHGPHEVIAGDGRWTADPRNFVRRLTKRTGACGRIMPEGDAPSDYPYGPYLSEFPSNPFATADAAGVEIGTAQTPDGDPGWFFNTQTGEFSANHPEGEDL
jgi:hypothetical protein